MKIAMLSPEKPLPTCGGIARLVSILQTGLRIRGHHVDVFYPTLRFRELKFSKIPLMDYQDYDLVHVHGPTPLLSDVALIKQSRPIVYTHHCNATWISEIASNLYCFTHRHIAKMKAKAIIVLSKDYARLFNNEKKIFVVRPFSIQPPNDFLTSNEKEKTFTVLYVGQLRPFKGVDLLIKAAMLLNETRFLIVGEGYLKPDLIKMAHNMKNVEFLGHVSDQDLINYYRSSHVICLPSINTTEAWGLVLTEGAFYGCVPVASDILGVRENVNLLGGFLVNPKSVNDLTRKLRLIKESVDYETLMLDVQRKARFYHQENNMENYVRAHELVYEFALRKS